MDFNLSKTIKMENLENITENYVSFEYKILRLDIFGGHFVNLTLFWPKNCRKVQNASGTTFVLNNPQMPLTARGVFLIIQWTVCRKRFSGAQKVLYIFTLRLAGQCSHDFCRISRGFALCNCRFGPEQETEGRSHKEKVSNVDFGCECRRGCRLWDVKNSG
jgi:hypothetical protein